jgi:L-threonylcarbamoyladenylate synthase
MKIFKDCTEDQITQAAQALMHGHLVAFPTETVYGLGADASNISAVSRVYDLKGRPKDHPLIVHISSVNHITQWASEIPDYAFELAAKFWPGPMTLILPKTDLAKDFLTGNQNNVGLRIPSHPVALELLKKFESLGGKGIAAPSANKFGAVSPTTVEAVVEEFINENVTELMILDGGHSSIGLESTIIDCSRKTPSIVRPGAITQNMIKKIANSIAVDSSLVSQLKAPGKFIGHYAPRTKVVLDIKPEVGDGLIALQEFETPNNVVRLAAPKSLEEFAKQLYSAMRLGDELKVLRIIIIQPKNVQIGTAIRDRISKAANKTQTFKK